jgi:hypothetical protein
LHIVGEVLFFHPGVEVGEDLRESAIKTVVNCDCHSHRCCHAFYLCGVHGVFGAPGVGADKSAGAQEYSPEIPRHNAAHVRQPLLSEHLVNGDSGGAARFPVVGVPRCIVLPQNIRVAVVGSLAVHSAYLLDERDGFLLRPDGAEVPYELGFLLDKSGFATARDGLVFHEYLRYKRKNTRREIRACVFNYFQSTG